MFSLLLLLIGALIRLSRSRGNLVLENLVLHPTTRYVETSISSPEFRAFRQALLGNRSESLVGLEAVPLIVTPETVVRWHRTGFRMYWRLIEILQNKIPAASGKANQGSDQEEKQAEHGMEL
jgi:hypothetical protein